MRLNKIIILILLLNVALSQSKNTFNGFLDFNYISRTSDGSIINLPYRLFSLRIDHENEDILIKSNLAIEHKIREETHFLSNESPSDFNLDLRELYLQLFTSWGELKIGKIIHTWGNVDENSPIDIVSPYDYYFTFDSGTDKKMGIFSSAVDIYANNYKLGFTFSPIHNTHRTPLEKDDFPIKLPTYPYENEFMKISGSPLEYGFYGSKTLSKGDISVHYFNGYDRLFNLSGVNVYANGPDKSFSIIDIIYGYRKTKILGVGTNFFIGDATFRGDAAFFNTSDVNDEDKFLERKSSYLPTIYDSLHYSYPLKEEVNYFQTTLQFEIELPFDIQFTGQFFTYDTLDYKSDSLPLDEDISIPNLEITVDELNPENIFTPGYGSSIGILTKKAAVISLQKSILDDQLTFKLSSLLDIDNNSHDNSIPGIILSLETSYRLNNNLIIDIGYTKITGDSNHPLGEDYRLNIMEDFSHFRTNLKYNF